jgi:hypothetical protein
MVENTIGKVSFLLRVKIFSPLEWVFWNMSKYTLSLILETKFFPKKIFHKKVHFTIFYGVIKRKFTRQIRNKVANLKNMLFCLVINNIYSLS